MHLVASFGLLTMLSGLDFIRLILKGNLFENFWANISKLIMLIPAVFLYTYVLCLSDMLKKLQKIRLHHLKL